MNQQIEDITRELAHSRLETEQANHQFRRLLGWLIKAEKENERLRMQLESGSDSHGH